MFGCKTSVLKRSWRLNIGNRPAAIRVLVRNSYAQYCRQIVTSKWLSFGDLKEIRVMICSRKSEYCSGAVHFSIFAIFVVLRSVILMRFTWSLCNAKLTKSTTRTESSIVTSRMFIYVIIQAASFITHVVLEISLISHKSVRSPRYCSYYNHRLMVTMLCIQISASATWKCAYCMVYTDECKWTVKKPFPLR